MQINYELANYVIGEASKLTSLPLLFTDKSGEVLCGRKPSDVGLVIPAVKETVQSGTQVPLNPKEPPFAKGAVFPVMLRDQIIGAAAVLGSPSAYEPCLAMLSFTLNTLVEKTTEVERASQKRNLTETWIANLFNEDYTDWLELDNTARMLGIRVDVPSTVIVFSVTRKAHGIGSSLYLEPTFVENYFIHNIGNYVGVNYYYYLGRNLYAFSIRTTMQKKRVRDSIQNDLAEELQAMGARFEQINLSFVAGIGSASSTLRGIRKSFLEARRSVELLQRYGSERSVMYVYDWGILYFLSQIPTDTVQNLAANYLSGGQHVREELLETVEAFFRNNCALQKTADELNMHKNTLLYRFRRVRDACGLDPQQFSDAVVLQLLLYFRRLHPHLLESVIDGKDDSEI